MNGIKSSYFGENSPDRENNETLHIHNYAMIQYNDSEQ